LEENDTKYSELKSPEMKKSGEKNWFVAKVLSIKKIRLL